METRPLWQQFTDCTDISAATHVSHAILQTVMDDKFFAGAPRSTVPRPVSDKMFAAGDNPHATILAWKSAVRKWIATLPDSLAAHFKQIEVLTKPA